MLIIVSSKEALAEARAHLWGAPAACPLQESKAECAPSKIASPLTHAAPSAALPHSCVGDGACRARRGDSRMPFKAFFTLALPKTIRPG